MKKKESLASKATFEGFLTSNAGRIKKAIPKGSSMTFEKAIEQACNSYRNNPLLRSCSHEELLTCVLVAAKAEIPIDGTIHGAAIVASPHIDKATGEVKYAAALRTYLYALADTAMDMLGYLTDVTISDVREQDRFDVFAGTEPALYHTCQVTNHNRGPVVAVYATATLDTLRTNIHTVLGLEELAEIRANHGQPENWLTTPHGLALAKRVALIRLLTKLMGKRTPQDLRDVIMMSRVADDFPPITRVAAATTTVNPNSVATAQRRVEAVAAASK